MAGCPAARETPKPEAAKPAELKPSSGDDREERNNLASLADGACVVERTGEAYLGASALNLIDGNPDSQWLAPPHDMPQSATVALPARSRITAVGVRSEGKGDFHLRTATVEAATGNGGFRKIADITLNDTPDAQLFNVTPVEADRVRVTMLSGPKPGHEVRAESFIVRGQELEPPTPPHLAGSWKMNGRDASFAQFGNHVIGVIQINRLPMLLEGGVEGSRMLRLAWIRGAEFGVAAGSVSRDGKHNNLIDWHEEPIPLFFDEAWFGDRTSDATPADDSETFAVSLLRHTGRWPLYGIAFRPDGSIDAAASEHALRVLAAVIARSPVPLRLVSHELREATPAANRARAQRALDALQAELKKRNVNLANVQLVTAGSDNPRQLAVTEPARLLYSSVDLEISSKL
jgi:hypothetical protein